MDSSNTDIIKTWFRDENGNNHHLSAEPMEGEGTEFFYHCIIDGTKKMDVEIIYEKWQDVEKKEGKLAEIIGAIVEDYSE